MMAATAKAIAPAERRRMTPRKWLSHLGWRHLVGLVAVVYAAFPVVYVVSASLTTDGLLGLLFSRSAISFRVSSASVLALAMPSYACIERSNCCFNPRGDVFTRGSILTVSLCV